jgi:hypothetical protein
MFLGKINVKILNFKNALNLSRFILHLSIYLIIVLKYVRKYTRLFQPLIEIIDK